ncbi:aminotransferase class V-fold PLP-dependent enzyme [Raoultibacter timonensis]|uniref:aminotransferase class V-fold PLP-dependent enzyme n=1 Tax=Raoultibacter timonensis TaxID=1907662 RepID=UPI0026DCC5E8|nr:SufS family cysteine desulfurase [Raoultibacter timonensis]
MNDFADRIDAIRGDFPILEQRIGDRPLIYLDNGATTQMPDAVLDALAAHYRTDNANVHRGIHTLSERSTAAFERARRTVQRFVNAAESDEIVFTGGTTDAINMAARAWEERVGPGSTIAVTALEHHANLVPWQQLCKRTGARFEVIPLTPQGDIDLEALETVLRSQKVSLVAVAHVSNVLGSVNPVREIAAMAHERGTCVLVDAAQSVRHEIVDVQDADCDFLCFSGHKMLGPAGIGVLYGKRELLAELSPVRFGGEMVDKVSFAETTFEKPPLRFEAGTPNYPGAIALAAAIGYIESAGRDKIASYEHELTAYAERALGSIDGLHVLGDPARRAGCLSFTVDDVHPFDLATFMDKQGVALRSGNQCAQPLLHEVYGVQNVTRLSPAFYNTHVEIDSCVELLGRTVALLRAAR